MTVRLYRSTDASAPALSGSAGSLITVLDAVLVNGYGSLTAAGWTKPFTSTNRASYRMVTTGGNTGFYLNVDDGVGPATAREANVTGFETMSAFGVGTGQFPTASQLNLGSAPAGCCIVRKSATADGTARPWVIVADGSVLYMFVDTGDVSLTMYPWMFGDIFSYKTNDTYKCALIARNSFNTGSGQNDPFHTLPVNSNSSLAFFQTNVGQYLARTFTGVGGSRDFGKHMDISKVGFPTSASLSNFSQAIGIGYYIGFAPGYPNPADGGLLMSPLWVHHPNTVRGYLKGCWAPCHTTPLGHLDTFSGTGNMAGKSFIAINILAWNTANFTGQVIMEYSDTWS